METCWAISYNPSIGFLCVFLLVELLKKFFFNFFPTYQNYRQNKSSNWGQARVTRAIKIAIGSDFTSDWLKKKSTCVVIGGNDFP